MLPRESPNYPPAVLLRGRVLIQATVTGLPVTVTAGTIASLTATFTPDASFAKPSHTRIRISVWGSKLTTDSGGQPFITIQSANLQLATSQISQPLNSGSSLGAYNGSTLNGFVEFDTDDLTVLGITPPTTFAVVIVVKNSDSSDHQVTGGTTAVLIESTQYADAYRATV